MELKNPPDVVFFPTQTLMEPYMEGSGVSYGGVWGFKSLGQMLYLKF